MLGWGTGGGESLMKTPTYNVGVGYLRPKKLVDQDYSVGIGYPVVDTSTGSYNTFIRVDNWTWWNNINSI